MATVTINGVEIADDPRAIRRELGKVRRAEAKAEAARRANSDAAQQRAEAGAYRVLARKAHGEEAPRAWRFYAPGDEWSQHLFTVDTGQECRTLVKSNPPVMLKHWGQDFVGAVCNGSGYAWIIFLRDQTQGTVECYAVGVSGDQHHLADCPGIGMDFFSRES